jgi:hypothetical protein
MFEQGQKQDWLIHFDSLLVPTALSMEQFLATKNMAMAPTPPSLT